MKYTKEGGRERERCVRVGNEDKCESSRREKRSEEGTGEKEEMDEEEVRGRGKRREI